MTLIRFGENISALKQKPRMREFTILAQDPEFKDANGAVLTAKVQIPYDLLEPGPRSHRLHVVDYDTSTSTLRDPIDITSNLAAPADLTRIEADNGFHSQNAFVIVARTLNYFESALGRRVTWGFDGHQLYVVPHAFQEGNAFYSEDDRGLFFGYLDSGNGLVFTCLSHDIVAHETTHAVLDGLRDRYDTPGLSDQGAFHEAVADLVALLSTFSLPNVVEALIGHADPSGNIVDGDVSEERLGATFASLAEQLGRSVYGRSARGLRNSIELMRAKGATWRDDPSFEEPHRRGEVLVAAMMGGFVKIWRRRLGQLIIEGKLNREKAAEEGAKAADHLLKMSIRALDYCPPLEFEFEDFLDALLVSDEEMEPDDKYEYRKYLSASFAAFGITQPKGQTVDFAHPDPAHPLPPFRYDGFNFIRLRSDSDEVFRFIWENRATLELDLSLYTRVEGVRQVMRVGSDGFVVTEVMIDYVQELEGKRSELEARVGIDLGEDVPADRVLKVYGGGVLIFDQFGRAKFHVAKPLNDERRQRQRLEYLVRSGRSDTRGRFGFSDGASKGQRFAAAHKDAARPGEEW